MIVSVRSIPNTFHRAGMAFTKVATAVDVDEDTVKILKNEPMLIVEPVDESNDEKTGDDATDKKTATQTVAQPKAQQKGSTKK